MNFEVEYNSKNNKENISKKYGKPVKRKKKKSSNKRKTLILVSTILFIFLATSITMYFYLNSNTQTPVVKIPEEKIKTKELTIFDENSNDRPIAVMIDNNVGNNNHIGLQDSYLNYEIIVEGGLTRIMAIFKDKNVSTIGPVRSSRHYFLDYALENDAIYTHYGWSTYAQSDISALKINNINGLTDETPFWRDKTIRAPHNVFTSLNKIKSSASEKNYKLTTNNWRNFNYNPKEINLNEKFESTSSQENESETKSYVLRANNISMNYSNSQIRSYQYDSTNKYYLRFMNGVSHNDKETGETLHYKNIIIEKVYNHSIDSYGRQDLTTTGTGEGYFVTDGYAVPINWTKSSRSAKTKYTYKNGEEIELNDGNTFIQIIPTSSDIIIE